MSPSPEPIKFRIGTMWLQRFDILTSRGLEPRDVVAAMAEEMDRLGDIAMKRVELGVPTVIKLFTRCPFCGKELP